MDKREMIMQAVDRVIDNDVRLRDRIKELLSETWALAQEEAAKAPRPEAVSPDTERLDWLLKYAYAKSVGSFADWEYHPIKTREELDRHMKRHTPQLVDQGDKP